MYLAFGSFDSGPYKVGEKLLRNSEALEMTTSMPSIRCAMLC